MKIYTKKGFTLIETFIAISILMIVIVGPLTISQRSLASAKYARDRISAYYLAEDAIEYIRHLRDDKYYTMVGNANIDWSSTGFLSQVSSCYSSDINNPKWCVFDTKLSPEYPITADTGPANQANMRTCSPNTAKGCELLNFNHFIQTYTYDKQLDCTQADISAERQHICSTPFTRSISITDSPFNGNKELVVTVEVRWKSGLFGENDERNLYRVQENLFDWQII